MAMARNFPQWKAVIIRKHRNASGCKGLKAIRLIVQAVNKIDVNP
jgi:hypothetical protein